MKERRKAPRKDWVVGRDEKGRSVLEWKVDYRHTERQESDPSAQTYNFLKKLTVPELELEEDRNRPGRGRNPYDSTRALAAKQPGGKPKKNPAHKEPGSN